jgi:hypothetical protein
MTFDVDPVIRLQFLCEFEYPNLFIDTFLIPHIFGFLPSLEMWERGKEKEAAEKGVPIAWSGWVGSFS